MATIPEFQKQRENKYLSLVLLKDEIKDYIKNPVETVPIDNLKYQFDFLIREIKIIDTSIRTIILSQIETAKLDLKNLELQLSFVPKPFSVDVLPPYSEVFR